MNSTALQALAAVTFLSITQPQDAQTQATRQVLETRYGTLADAYNKKDVKAILSHTTSDYTWQMLDGKVLKRKEAEQALKDDLANTETGKWAVKMKSLMVSGPIATVTLQMHFNGTKLDPAKKTYKFEMDSTERQTWQQDNGQWMLKSDVVLAMRSASNGQKLSPQVDSTRTIGEGGRG